VIRIAMATLACASIVFHLRRGVYHDLLSRSIYERVARIDRVIVRMRAPVIGYSDYPADFVTFFVSISLLSPFHF
jgi:hypothetical protein